MKEMPIDEEALGEARYRIYQLLWMAINGYTLPDMMKSMAGYRQSLIDETGGDPDLLADIEEVINDPERLFDDWAYERGFDTNIWPCLEEYLMDDDEAEVDGGTFDIYDCSLTDIARRIMREKETEEQS